MMRLKGFAALLLLAVLLGSTASAQFSLTVDTVMTDDFPNIKVNVTTRYSGVVTRSIDSSHFRLMEDGFVQEPLHFSCPDPTESFSLAIVLGIGSSMSAGDIGFAKGVASRITEGMNGISDEVAVLTYDDNVNLQVEFTHIPVVVQQRVDAITPSGRGNYFWDGVWEAVRYCANDGSRMSRGVLVLSNGKGDGGSKTINDVVQLAKLAKLPVYCLGISAVGSDQDMRDLAAQTGGRYFDNADQTVRELVDALNGTPPWCTLEYTTNHHCRSGVDREISIRVREDNDSASVTHTFPLAADPADRVPVTMQVDTGTVIAGKTTDVPLLLTPAVQNQRLVNGELVLLFDTSLVRLTGARTDGYLAEGMQASVRQAQDGAVVELMGAAKLNGSGPMMMLQFTGGIVTAPTPVVVNIDTLTGQQETCLDRAYPSSTLTIVPKRASIRTTAQPVVFTWDSGAKRYTPHPGILTVEVTNDGDLPVTNLTATLDENTDLRMAYGGSRSVAVNPPSLEPGKKGTAVWYVQVLPQSTERTAQVDAVITSDEGATATQRLFVNIKPAESAFALQCDADDITVSGGAYTPDPAEVRAVVTAAGTMDGPAGEVTIVLPPELTLESGDATQPFASMAPGNSETLAWTVQYPEREEDYNILLIATAAGYPSDTCRVTLRVPPKLSAQFDLLCRFEPSVIDSTVGFDPLTVSSWIKNTGNVEAQGVRAMILLSPGFMLAAGDSVSHFLPDPLAPGDSVRIAWRIRPIASLHCEPDTVSIDIRVIDRFSMSESCTAVGILLYPTNLLPELLSAQPAALDTLDRDTEQTFIVTAIDNEGATLTYKWFLDGSEQSATGAQFTHTFDTVGDTEVKVEIYDPCTLADSEPVTHVWSFHVRDLTDISGRSTALRSFAITGNYPNPFNPGTVIEYRVPGGRHEVRLEVVDAYGRVVHTLVDDVRAGGLYRQSFDAAELPTGTYLARLRSGGVSVMHRMVLLK